MKNHLPYSVGVLLCAVCLPSRAASAYSDDFNRASLGGDYAVTVSAGDGGALINGASFLELTNDTSATANANGRVSAAVSFSAFASPFSGTLSGNTGLVTWEVNLRYNRTADPSGFGGGGYAAAFVLAASQGDFMGGSGYAVVYGSASAPEPFRLVRYSGGLGANANLTDIINPAATLAAVNDYASLRVTYNPTGNAWSLFARDDGASAWSAPSTLSEAHRLGTQTVDAVHTASALTHAGFFWNHSTAANQTAQFDNFSVQVVPEPPIIGTIGAGVALLCRIVRRRKVI